MRILATWLAFQLCTISSLVTATDKIVEGELSSSRDDAQSRATCPQGYTVTHCEVKSDLDTTQSDGAFVDPSSNGQVCVAVNGAHGPGVVALAKCSEDGQVPDSCDPNNHLLPRFITQHSRGATPSVTCPKGYEQTVCNARSPWLSYLPNKGINSKGVIPNEKTCAVPDCSHNWCEVTAVCKVLELPEEYIDAVCPVIIPVEGSPSLMADDALSIASCPMGYVASHCEVKTGLVGSKSDGAYVDPIRMGGECVAVHAGNGSPAAVALAQCSRNTHVPDPCRDGKVLSKFINLHSIGPNPRVSCPAGYQQTVCNARTPWMPLLWNKGINPKGIIPNENACTVPECTETSWCEVTAICKIMYSEAYKKKVCPERL